MMDRRTPTPPIGDLEDRHWEVSPSISDGQSETSGEDVQSEGKYTTQIKYITDSDTKLSLAVGYLLSCGTSANGNIVR